MIRKFEVRHYPNNDGFDQFTVRADDGSPYTDIILKDTNDPVELFRALAKWLEPAEEGEEE